MNPKEPADEQTPDEDEPSEFEKFEQLAKKLVKVPKRELDEKSREDG